MNVIAFAGRKRSGKDSALKYVFGHICVKREILERFDITEEGDLIVPAEVNGERTQGIFDLDRKDHRFLQFFHDMFWPVINIYHFADILKEICTVMYGLSHDQLFGTSKDKDSITPYIWADLQKVLPTKVKRNKTEFVTAREFIQNIADVFRAVNDNCFTNPTIDRIVSDQNEFALVGDVRRIVEVEAIKKIGGKVIYLTRNPEKDNHHTETEFDNVEHSFFDAVIDNENMSMTEKNNAILSVINDWNLF